MVEPGVLLTRRLPTRRACSTSDITLNWLPILYPKLSGNVVDTINMLIARAQPFELQNGDVAYSIRPLSFRERCDSCISLCVEAGGVPIGVHLSPATLEAVLMDLLSRQAFEALDDDLRLAVLEIALAEPLSTLSRYLQTPLTLTGFAAVGEPPSPVCVPYIAPHSLLFEIRRKSDESLFVVQVDLNAGLPEPARSVLHDTPVYRTRDLGSLPAPVVFEFGTASLSMSEIRSLEPGDIILFDECFIDGGQLRINVGDRMFHSGTVNGFDLTVAASESSEGVTR